MYFQATTLTSTDKHFAFWGFIITICHNVFLLTSTSAVMLILGNGCLSLRLQQGYMHPLYKNIFSHLDHGYTTIKMYGTPIVP